MVAQWPHECTSSKQRLFFKKSETADHAHFSPLVLPSPNSLPVSQTTVEVLYWKQDKAVFHVLEQVTLCQASTSAVATSGSSAVPA